MTEEEMQGWMPLLPYLLLALNVAVFCIDYNALLLF